MSRATKMKCKIVPPWIISLNRAGMANKTYTVFSIFPYVRGVGYKSHLLLPPPFSSRVKTINLKSIKKHYNRYYSVLLLTCACIPKFRSNLIEHNRKLTNINVNWRDKKTHRKTRKRNTIAVCLITNEIITI